MIDRLDRHVGKAVLGSVAASLLFFVFLTVVLDLLKSLGDYLDAADKSGVSTVGLLWFLFGYYLKLLPLTFVGVAPFATVIGCMFAVARLMGQNELQPMLFIGRSMVRILRPALLTGAVVGIGMVGCWQWVVPVIATDIDSAATFLSGGDRPLKNLVLEQRGEAFTGLRVREYQPMKLQMIDVDLLRTSSQPGDAVLVRASSATWDAALGDWRLENGVRRTPRGEDPCTILGAPEWTPEVVRQRGQDTVDCDTLGYTELLELREQRPNRKDVAMALHRHITYPLANLVLLLLALPFAIHFERGSRIERVLSAIVICAAYMLFDITCQSLGYNGWWRPAVAAWAPTILFGSLGVVMFGSVRS